MITQPTSINSNMVIECNLNSLLDNLEKELDSDVLTFVGPIVPGIDMEIRDAIEMLAKKKDRLSVVLETEGGYIETVKRIAETFRRHYKNYVEFIVPNIAMSAGTILVMSGNAIHMDYFSVLGPIDPQIQRADGKAFIPALGYIEKYNQLIEKSYGDEGLSMAELNYLIAKFDPAELHKYEHERELSIELLEEWLVKYKFKNWKATETRKKKVTNQMRIMRAKAIGKQLNDTKKWHSHGRGISMDVLRKELKLQIEDFGEKENLNENIKLYYRLLKDYMMKRSFLALVHSSALIKPII